MAYNFRCLCNFHCACNSRSSTCRFQCNCPYSFPLAPGCDHPLENHCGPSPASRVPCPACTYPCLYPCPRPPERRCPDPTETPRHPSGSLTYTIASSVHRAGGSPAHAIASTVNQRTTRPTRRSHCRCGRSPRRSGGSSPSASRTTGCASASARQSPRARR